MCVAHSCSDVLRHNFLLSSSFISVRLDVLILKLDVKERRNGSRSKECTMIDIEDVDEEWQLSGSLV